MSAPDLAHFPLSLAQGYHYFWFKTSWIACVSQNMCFPLQDSRRLYEQAMQAYKPQKKKKDPNAPKQPLSAYFIFSSEERLKVKNEHPSYSICEVAKELGRYGWAVIQVLSDSASTNPSDLVRKQYTSYCTIKKGTHSKLLWPFVCSQTHSSLLKFSVIIDIPPLATS